MTRVDTSAGWFYYILSISSIIKMNVNDNMITYTITRVETPGWFCYKLYIKSDINGANLSVCHYSKKIHLDPWFASGDSH